MDSVRADQRVELGPRAVGERRLDAIAVVGECGQPVSEVDPLGGERVLQRGEEVGAMHLVVREAERGLEWFRQRRSQQGPAVVPATLMPRQRPHARALQHAGQPKRRAARATRSD